MTIIVYQQYPVSLVLIVICLIHATLRKDRIKHSRIDYLQTEKGLLFNYATICTVIILVFSLFMIGLDWIYLTGTSLSLPFLTYWFMLTWGKESADEGEHSEEEERRLENCQTKMKVDVNHYDGNHQCSKFLIC